MPSKSHVLNVIVGILSPLVIVLWTTIKISTLCSKVRYSVLNEWLFTTYMKAFLFFFEYISIERFYLYGDVNYHTKKDEKVLYMANHLSTADWIICCILTARQGNIGRCKFVLHKMLKYIPIFGFYLAQDSCIFVDRSNFQEGKALETLRSIREMKSKAWITIYPEGRRYNPDHLEVINNSRKFAVGANIQPYRLHLTPRTRGFRLILDHFRDYFDAVYDVTVVYADKNGHPLDRQKHMPQLPNWLNSRHTLHVHIRRIPIKSVPLGDEEIDSWIYDLFHVKDEFISNVQESFHNKLTNMTKGDTSGYLDDVKCYENGDAAGSYLIPVQRQILNCMPSKMGKTALILKPLSFLELLPSVMFFYGLTLFWVFGFGWYGPLSFVVVALFGSMLGELYVHYCV